MTIWRRPSDYERQLFRTMLVGFRGSSEYLQQAEAALVREYDEECQLEFQIPDEISSVTDPEARRYALVEAAFRDADGIPASFIIHEDSGRLRWLEKFKTNSTPLVCSQPPISTLSIQLP